ncbi:unnamed protein product [Cuscuta campestris]|uniref:Lipoxygenase domain-containing protein n=1 Tax=Cuscuta campestris TaxID=132261 RepID=A0A484LUF9_9ASTE|nr:unnamed protein product [Cuscuta campestris]
MLMPVQATSTLPRYNNVGAFVVSGETTLAVASFPAVVLRPTSGKSRLRKTAGGSLGCGGRAGCRVIKAVASTTAVSEKVATSVKAVVTVQKPSGGILKHLSLSGGCDDLTDLLGKSLLLEIVAAQHDPKTGREKNSIQGYAHRQGGAGRKDEEVKYECNLVIPKDFGEVGAILIENEHHQEMFVKKIVLDGLFHDGASLSINCDSWVHSKFDNSSKRAFFSNKSYLPSQTPSGLKKLREIELAALRGDGTGERQKFDRIYDYDVYNDIGDPDGSDDGLRPVLGGKEHPYPRRCRTGRPLSTKDPSSESRSSSVYVPRDEALTEVKNLTFAGNTFYSVLHAVVPVIESILVDNLDMGFPHFPAIDDLYNNGFNIPSQQTGGILNGVVPRIIKSVADFGKHVFQFETPAMIDRDKFSWYKDEEFSRQTLAA